MFNNKELPGLLFDVHVGTASHIASYTLSVSVGKITLADNNNQENLGQFGGGQHGAMD
jgi:hypothetical protein